MLDIHGRLYFRTRENGATVFRIDTENKSRRLEMHQIGTVAIRKKEFRPHGDAEITASEQKEINSWIEERVSFLDAQQNAEITGLIDALKSAAHWMNSQAQASDIKKYSTELFLAMHDLRGVLDRKLGQGDD